MTTTRPGSRIVTLAAFCLLFAVAPLLAASTVVSCPFSTGGDDIGRGFYLQSYAGSNLRTVSLAYTANVAGTYTITLNAHRGAFNGPLLGSRSVAVTLNPGLFTVVNFDFGGVAVPTGATLAFSQSATGGQVFYNVGPCSPGSCSACPGVVETNDTTPPLSTAIRQSVGVTVTQDSAAGVCTPSDTVLCIDNNPGDRRFMITATYSTTQSGGLSGNGHAIPLSSLGVNQGGLFWFFARTNPEMLVKVLNACATNNRFWVFFSAGTNVGFSVTVRDTVAGSQKTYINPDLNPAPPLQDTNAFSCP
ncbi:MAG: hypothetical protein QOJ16_2942 [Acidobacteriota bacterium]|jgi:hypothetical protein|nr:hypothetical protein [Acidobacteriota bacterium]